MQLDRFSLWLFDMDGLLVDTEHLHLLAYQNICKNRGGHLPWTLEQFLQIAHKSSSALKEELYELFPQFRKISWNTLYAEKKEEYLKCLQVQTLKAMPGAQLIVSLALELGVIACVVTHSPKQQTEIIRQKLPFLDQIPHWITREDYERAKPDPQCYKKAIDRFTSGGSPPHRVIGFEDSARGLLALMGTASQAVLVANTHYPQLDAYKGRFYSVKSFLELLKQQQKLPISIEMALEQLHAS